jgi:hypothetical protein
MAQSKKPSITPVEQAGFFDRNIEERPEIVGGLIREGDIAILAGNFGEGKSPLIANLTVHLLNGLEWCGRQVAKRPVVIFDFESPETDFRIAIRRIALRLEVRVPQVPRELQVFLQNARDEPETERLWKVMAEGEESKLALIESTLKDKPNAVVFIDPLAMYFQINWTKQIEVVRIYHRLRLLLHKYSRAAIVSTFNLRKQDRKNRRADLLSDPRSWLEEVSGSLDILNRSDVRLGIETHNDDVRVINGIVRGREMHPLLIHPVCNREGQLTGFEQVTPSSLDLLRALTETQKQHWDKLPTQFRFEQVADNPVPRTSLHRLIPRLQQLGVLKHGDDGIYRKQFGGDDRISALKL